MPSALVVDSPLGPLGLQSRDGESLSAIRFGATERGPTGSSAPAPVLVEVARQLGEYFAGERRSFELPIAPSGTPFRRSVWQALLAIPYGQTLTYGQVAAPARPAADRVARRRSGQRRQPDSGRRAVPPGHRGRRPAHRVRRRAGPQGGAAAAGGCAHRARPATAVLGRRSGVSRWSLRCVPSLRRCDSGSEVAAFSHRLVSNAGGRAPVVGSGGWVDVIRASETAAVSHRPAWGKAAVTCPLAASM